MILGHHIILSAYGFWLPNDPRGSWSEFVGSFELFRFGPATKVTVQHSVADTPHNRALRFAAKEALKLPPVVLSGVQAHAVGRGFSDAASKSKLTIWACSIMPTHMHLVVAQHDLPVEQIIIALKGGATRRLNREGINPFERFAGAGGRMPRVFARGGWKVFLNDEDHVRRAIAYVNDNPVKEGKPSQLWTCVTPFEGAPQPERSAKPHG